MLVLGLDPGTAITGFGLVRREGHHLEGVAFGVIRTDAGLPMPARLHRIFHDLQDLFGRYRPEAVAVEQLFFRKNVRTAMAVGQARGVVLLAAAAADLAVAEYTPLQVKQAVVGYGKAEKRQVQEMVRILLGLREIPRPDDAADALAIAICHAHCSGSREVMPR